MEGVSVDDVTLGHPEKSAKKGGDKTSVSTTQPMTKPPKQSAPFNRMKATYDYDSTEAVYRGYNHANEESINSTGPADQPTANSHVTGIPIAPSANNDSTTGDMRYSTQPGSKEPSNSDDPQLRHQHDQISEPLKFPQRVKNVYQEEILLYPRSKNESLKVCFKTYHDTGLMCYEPACYSVQPSSGPGHMQNK